MRAATVAPVQPALFDLVTQYSDTDRLADRKLCRAYLKQWAGSFKKQGSATKIAVEDFHAAAKRLAQ